MAFRPFATSFCENVCFTGIKHSEFLHPSQQIKPSQFTINFAWREAIAIKTD
ncbi:hypothetical protein [Nostoc sp. UIC 10630]|uniref:hypothetical protein n=1 Tax=Nostoc sp. UIC 10630 TaxID=2100146 RepID=UPI001FB1196D|nr:hypothetical protein [Nostoc sp. UIC 10630]